MNINLALQQYRQRPLLIWMLAIFFLSQSIVLPALSQAKPVQTANGQWVMMCTLQGLKSVLVGKNKPPVNYKTSQHCSACTLSSSIDASSLTVPFLFHVAAHAPDVISFNRNLPSAYQLTATFYIRAPPSAFIV